ncbi:MAG: Uma2 family endonuclease, partial [Isosphaeraceae bacterium]
HHPGPADVALVVEVADSTLADDRAMAATYGGGGIPVYWIVNVAGRTLECTPTPNRGPGPGARIQLPRSWERRSRLISSSRGGSSAASPWRTCSRERKAVPDGSRCRSGQSRGLGPPAVIFCQG